MNTHWSVIDKADLHHRLKNAILDLSSLVTALNLAVQTIVERLGCFSSHSSMKVWFESLLCRRQKSEL